MEEHGREPRNLGVPTPGRTKAEPTVCAGDYLRHKLTHRRMIALTDEAKDKTFFARDLVDGIHMSEPVKIYVVEVEPWKDTPAVGRS